MFESVHTRACSERAFALLIWLICLRLFLRMQPAFLAHLHLFTLYIQTGLPLKSTSPPSLFTTSHVLPTWLVVPPGLTPQPTVNLQALVSQVLGTAGVAQPSDMSAADLVSKIGQLKLISSELTGLTDNLITLGDGSHVQPNLHIPGETTTLPLVAAVSAGAGIGLTQADLTLIGDQSGSTPYGSLVDFSKSLQEPFKPVTHGQFRFTNLNIVDKFGQVISGIQPAPEQRVPSGLPDSLHPCLGDQVCPGLIPGTTQLNTVTALTSADPQLPGGYPLCPYVQLTPAINQNARINAAFVEPVTDAQGNFGGWKTTNDWEQPVWAW